MLLLVVALQHLVVSLIPVDGSTNIVPSIQCDKAAEGEYKSHSPPNSPTHVVQTQPVSNHCHRS